MSKRNAKAQAGAFVEQLEDRLLLSVTATVVGNTLLLRSDNTAGENVTLAQAGGAIQLTGVANNFAKTLVTGTGAGQIQNITIVFPGNRNDTVTLLSPITNIKTFNANLGDGDNQLVNQGNIAASGTITVSGSAATNAFAAPLSLNTRTVVTAATVTTTTDTFNTAATAASTTVSLLGLAAVGAQGTISVPNWNGAVGVGSVTFANAVASGALITITDGFTGGYTENFLAGNLDDAPAANTNNQTLHFNTNAMTAQQAMVSFAARVNATRVATGNGHFAITVAATADLKTDTVTNNNSSSLDNNTIVLNPAATASGVASSAISGGATPASAGDSFTLNDGVTGHPTFTFTCQANGTAVAANDNVAGHTYVFDLGAGGTKVGDTLDTVRGANAGGLRQAINVANATGQFNITAAAVANGGSDASSYIVLTNSTAGKAGNQVITFTGPGATAWASPTGGMVDGTDIFAAGETITIGDGALLNASGVPHTAVTFTATVATTDATHFAIGGTAIATLNNLGTAIGLQGASLFITPGAAGAFNGGAGGTMTLTINGGAAIAANSFNAGLMAAVNTTVPTATNTSAQWSQLAAQNNLGTKTGGLQAFGGGVNSQTVTAGDLVTISDGTTTKIFEAVVPGNAAAAGHVAFNDTWTGTTPANLVSPAQSLVAAINTNLTTIGASANNSGVGPIVTLNALTTGPGGITVNTSSVPGDITAAVITPGATVTTTTTQNQNITAGARLIIGNTVFLASSVNSGTVFAIGATTIDTANNLAAAINASSLGITAAVTTVGTNVFPAGTTNVATTITLTATAAGAAGNVTGSGTAPFAAFTGLAGGADAANLVNGDSVTLNDGTTTKTLTATTGTAVAGTSFAIGLTPAATAANLVAAINNAAFGLKLAAVDASGTTLSDTITVSNTASPAIGALGNQAIGVSGVNISSTSMGGGSLGGFTTTQDFIVTVNGDQNNNVIDLLNVTVGRNLLINANTGGGAEDGYAGNQITLDSVTVAGQTKINTGGGVDLVSIDDGQATTGSTFNGVVLVNLGKSADTLLLSQGSVNTTFNKSATFLTGGGADILQDSTQTKYTKASGNKFSFVGVAGQHALLNALGTSLATASATTVVASASNVNG
jgi:hypothetical protein